MFLTWQIHTVAKFDFREDHKSVLKCVDHQNLPEPSKIAFHYEINEWCIWNYCCIILELQFTQIQEYL